MRKPTWLRDREGCHHWGSRATCAPRGSAGVVATACRHRETVSNTGNPSGGGTCPPTGDPRGSGRAVWGGGRSVVLMKPGNAGGGKGPQFRVNAGRGKARGDWCEPTSS